MPAIVIDLGDRLIEAVLEQPEMALERVSEACAAHPQAVCVWLFQTRSEAPWRMLLRRRPFSRLMHELLSK